MSEFVKMVKDGEELIEVHPSCVDDHKRLGWKVAEEQPTEEEAKAEAEHKEAEAKVIVKARAAKK